MTPVEEERATPAALEAFLKTEIDKWDRIIKDAGIDAAVTRTGQAKQLSRTGAASISCDIVHLALLWECPLQPLLTVT